MTTQIEAIIEWLNMDWLLPANKKDQQLARQILEKHLQPSKSVEELIEKREKRLKKYKNTTWEDDPIEIIQDLQDLLPEEREEEVIPWFENVKSDLEKIKLS